jgi:hypothetical protein
MDDGEVMVFLLSIVLAAVGIGATWMSALHPLFFRGNPAPGIVRLGVLLAMGWIVYVLRNHADPSITGIYVVFYLVMGYAAVKLFGQVTAGGLGFRTRVDAGERRNAAAAVVIAAFTVATGMIFGGSLWGEADPLTDDEGGWWIPVTFFLLGWITLLIAFSLFRRREEGSFARRLRQERSMADARAAGAFLLSSAVVLTDAVAGDFWGWAHALFSFGLLALLLLVHEAFSSWARPEGPGTRARPLDARRAAETLAYLLLAAFAWLAGRYVDVLAGVPL